MGKKWTEKVVKSPTSRFVLFLSVQTLHRSYNSQTFYSIFRHCHHQRPIEHCVTCAESRQNARQPENRIHHYESSYQRNHYEYTYERTSSTFQTSHNDELYRNLQERRQREQNMNILFFLLCICAFLIWVSTQGYDRNRNKNW